MNTTRKKTNVQGIVNLVRCSRRPKKRMIGKEVDVSNSVVDVKPIDAIEEMGDQHDDEYKECNYEASSRNELNVHQ